MSNNTISLALAKKWTKRWRKQEGNYNSHHTVNGFLIPLDDLKGILAEDGVVNVRGYLGIMECEDGSTEEKFIMVGVDANGKDMLPTNENGELAGDGDYVFDFSKPCPPTCDTSSPLNGGS